MNTEQMIEVMQAYVDGCEIEVRCSVTEDCWKPKSEPSWNWRGFDYRVKPEPLTLWVNVYPDGERCMHRSEDDALLYRGKRGRTVKMQEVTDV